MQVKPTIGTVVGKTDDNHWGQVLSLPQAYGVLEIESSDRIARQRGINILSKLSRLLEEGPRSLRETKEIAGEVMAQDGDVATLILLVPVGTIVYLVVCGQGSVYLKRDQQLSCLLTGAGELSGELAEGDALLLVSAGFAQALTSEELAQVFDHLSATEAAEKLTLLLHEANGGEGGAGLVFQVQQLLPLETEVPQTKESAMAQPVYEKIAETSEKLSFLERIKPLLSRRQLTRASYGFWRRLPAFHGNKLVALATVLLIFLFLVSVIVGVERQLATSQNASATKVLSEAQHDYEEGLALLDLNQIKGRERLSQAQALLSPLLASVSPKTKLGRQIKTLYQEVTDSLSMAMQVTRAEPQLFYDASLLKKGALILALALDVDTIVGLDKTTKTVFSLGLPAKSGQILAGGDNFQTASLVGLHGDNAYVFTGQGIHKIKVSDQITTPSVVKPDSQWGTIAALVAFGGNIYLLDTNKSRIWKYVATGVGFSDTREYLNPDTLPNLSQATGMAIDGSVWVGTTAGKILKFTQGQEATFQPQGVEPAFGTNLLVYTSDGVANIYVADRDNKRVVVLDKDGNYVAQYVWTGNLSPTQILVSEKLKTIFLLVDGKIYTLNLK